MEGLTGYQRSRMSPRFTDHEADEREARRAARKAKAEEKAAEWAKTATDAELDEVLSVPLVPVRNTPERVARSSAAFREREARS